MDFNTNMVCKLTALTKRQIDYWDRIHFIKPSTREASGYGSIRLYSFTDLVQLKVAATLKDKGLSVQKIRKSINYLKKTFPEVERPLAEMKLITDGESVFVLTEKKQVILDSLSKGQIVMSIAIGEIIEELRGEVEKISSERRYKVKVMTRSYEVILHPDLEDGGFWVECPELPGCASQGDTVEEALDMIKDAIYGHLEVLAEREETKKASA
jgi:predicted RNase H-like HicB family nuclease